MNITLQDRFRGSILWGALGDAIGAPFEFRSKYNIGHDMNIAIQEHGIEKAFCNFITKRSFTDDTKMTICQAESLINKKGFDPVDTASKFLDWFKSGDTRGIGQITTTAMRKLQDGVPWNKAARTDSQAAGNGSAMRIAPLALYYHNNLSDLRKYCDESASITHNCPEALAGTRAVAYAVARCTAGQALDASLFDEASEFAGKSDTTSKLIVGKQHFVKANEDDVIEGPMKALADIGTGFYVADTAAAAIYCAARFASNPPFALMVGIMAGGDTDTTAAVTGGILGAAVGTEGIPSSWLETLEGSDDLIKIADQLYESYRTDMVLNK